MSRIRQALVLLGAIVVLGAANWAILKKQAVLDGGRQVLLRLAPVHPRTLMPSDYMPLRYDSAAYPERAAMETLPWRGAVVLVLDADGVGRFARLDDGAALGDDEIRLAYKLRGRGSGMRYGAISFFFQEGQADRYDSAVYGVLRVDAEGNSVLAGLAGEDRQVIQPD